jgi:hypothetical protein
VPNLPWQRAAARRTFAFGGPFFVAKAERAIHVTKSIANPSSACAQALVLGSMDFLVLWGGVRGAPPLRRLGWGRSWAVPTGAGGPLAKHPKR